MPLTRIKNTAIGDGGISTAKLADGAVTTVKVADSAVNSAKIGVDVIVADDLAANSVTVSEITDGAVTGAKLANNLNYDSGTLYLDSTNDRIGIGTSTTTAGQVTIQGSGLPRQLVITDDGVEKLQIFQIGDDATIEAASSGSNSTNLIFKTASSGTESEAGRFDSSGNLLVGKTVTTFNTKGMQIDGTNGNFSITASGATTAFFNRTATNGNIAEFYKDGTAVGSIGTYDTDIHIGSGDVGLSFYDVGDTVLPFNPSTPVYRDNAIDLGNSSNRFKDLYLSGGAYLGGTGSANYLDDYEEGTFSPELRAAGGSNPTATYTNQTGFYIKIGQYVFVSMNLNWSSQSGGIGLLRLGNLPITPSSNSNVRALGSIPYIDCITGLSNAYGMAVHTSFPNDTNGPYLYYIGSNGNIASYVNIANVASSGAIQICLGYFSA